MTKTLPLPFLLLASVAVGACGPSTSEILTRARSMEVTLMRNLPAGMMSWISQQAEEVAAGRSDEDAVRLAARSHISGGEPNASGEEMLTFFVMMESVRKLDKRSAEGNKQREAMTLAGTRIAGLLGTISDDLGRNSGKDDSQPCACSSYEQPLNDLSSALEQSRTWITIAVRSPGDIGDLKGLQRDLKYVQNTMKEIKELQSLRMQAFADRSSKCISVISNLMKRVSDVDGSILQNMK